MKICVILEGCYPYVTGGVSSWIHDYIQAMPQHEFIVWAIGADSSQKGKFKYTLPKNVTEVHEIFLGDALKLTGSGKADYKFTQEENDALHDFINCASPNWEVLFRAYSEKNISPISFLQSRQFLNILTHVCETEYPYTAFSDLFHTVRSMLLPVLYILSSYVPQADVYHAIATGYAGVLARLGSYTYHVPYLITEHGIYTREREEEIIRARWVQPVFKKFWVRFFYMLSDCSYSKATMISSLFAGARSIQIEMGSDAEKTTYIGNGIHYENFASIGPKPATGHIDIGAVVRIAPIKDVKTMIYAFADLKQRIPGARLYICGPADDPDYARECDDLVHQLQLSDIIFTGTVDVREWYGKFDFTVLSSISEGMPLAVLESFASGRPCVTTDVGCCKELMNGVAEDDDLGPAGLCVAPMSPDKLADAMFQMCIHADQREAMGRAGRERVVRYFLHSDMVDKYLKLYDEVFKRWQGSASA